MWYRELCSNRLCDVLRLVVATITLSAVLVLAGCQNGVNMATTDATSNPGSFVQNNEPVSITGTVYVIADSQLTQLNNPPTLMARILAAFIPDSFAAIEGQLIPLTTGTVELFLLASNGSIVDSLGTTPIVDGTYSFPDTVIPSSTLIVSVQEISARAFVTGAVVDITPFSEVVVDSVLTSLPVSLVPLENYDVREVTAMVDLVTDRDAIDVTVLTFADGVTAIGNDAAATLNSLIASYAGFASIGQTFGVDMLDPVAGYTLAEHSVQLADPVGGPGTEFGIWKDCFNVAPLCPNAFPGFGILARGSQNGGFSVAPNGEGVSAGRMYPMATDFVDYGIAIALLNEDEFDGTTPGVPSWQTEFNDFIVTPAPNGQIVFNTEGGRTVVGFTTADKQIVVIPFDKTIGTTQQIRGVQVMTKRWDVSRGTGGTTNLNDFTANIAKLQGPYGMVEYLHTHDTDYIFTISAYAGGINFDGLVHERTAGEFTKNQVGWATRTGTYPYIGMRWNDPGMRNPVCALTATCRISGLYEFADDHVAKSGSLVFDYTVHVNGQVQMWDALQHIGEGGMTPDTEVVVIPANPYFSRGNEGPDNTRGYIVFGKEPAVPLPATQLAGTYNIVAEHTYQTEANGNEVHYGDRYGTLTLDGAGGITGGEFFKSSAELNITNMINITGTIVTSSTAREVVRSGGSYTLNANGSITDVSFIVDTVDENISPLPLKTVTMTGEGFVVKNGDFMTLELFAPDEASTSRGESGIMYLGKQF